LPYYKLFLRDVLLITAPATTKVFEYILILLFKFKKRELSETRIFFEKHIGYLFDFVVATSLTSNDYDIRGGKAGGGLLNLNAKGFAVIKIKIFLTGYRRIMISVIEAGVEYHLRICTLTILHVFSIYHHFGYEDLLAKSSVSDKLLQPQDVVVMIFFC